MAEEAQYHYKAVCRGLYAQAYELKAFLEKIEDSKVKKCSLKKNAFCFSQKVLVRELIMRVIDSIENLVKHRKSLEMLKKIFFFV